MSILQSKLMTKLIKLVPYSLLLHYYLSRNQKYGLD